MLPLVTHCTFRAQSSASKRAPCFNTRGNHVYHGKMKMNRGKKDCQLWYIFLVSEQFEDPTLIHTVPRNGVAYLCNSSYKDVFIAGCEFVSQLRYKHFV